jgi:hypothetical protein
MEEDSKIQKRIKVKKERINVQLPPKSAILSDNRSPNVLVITGFILIILQV